jgi:N-acetylglucosaminyl-diphospho-decaprenol L-rhamnosyltransferase
MINEDDVIGLILHFRTPDQTLNCLWSMQREKIRKAVIVDNSMDNGSSIGSMRGEFEILKNGGLDIQIISPDRNLGFAKGVNLGISHISKLNAKALLIINSDAELKEGSVEALMSGLETSPISIPQVQPQNFNANRSLFGFYQKATALTFTNPRLGCMAYPSGCCLLLGMKAAGSSLFDEDFFFYGEDVMLGHSLRNNRFTITECPNAKITHRGSGSAKNGSIFYEYHINRAHWLLANKLARNKPELIIFVFLRCILLPLRALKRSVQHKSSIPWQGFARATMDIVKGKFQDLTPPAEQVSSSKQQ